MLTALQLLRAKVLENKEMSELASEMQNLPQVLVNIKVDNSKKTLYKTDPHILEQIKKADQILSGRGRTLIRASGTEPLIRVMLEGNDIEEIHELAIAIAKAIETACSGKII